MTLLSIDTDKNEANNDKLTNLINIVIPRLKTIKTITLHVSNYKSRKQKNKETLHYNHLWRISNKPVRNKDEW